MVPEEPWRGEAFVARTEAELCAASQSRYGVISVNAALKGLRSTAGRFAVVALPCHVHGLRMLLAEDRGLRQKIALIVGLFCSSSVAPPGVRDLLRCGGIGRTRAVVDVRFREGPWPGRICAIGADGRRHELHRSNFKDGAINYLFSFYSPQRCLMCIDGSAEFADVSVSDVWQRESTGGYRCEGESRLLVRTAAGRTALENALISGVLEARDVTSDPVFRTHRKHVYPKQVTNRLRVERRQKAGLSAPSYDRTAASGAPADRRRERLKSAIHSIEMWPGLRYLLLKGLVSPLGEPIIWVRQQLKARRFRP
jgi:coenzyme F420 hydrogenase subunit beta